MNKKKLIKLKAKLFAAAIMASTMSVTGCGNENYEPPELVNEIGLDLNEEKENDTDLVKYIDENNNLSQQEKVFFTQIVDIISRHSLYMDKLFMPRRLKELKVEYVENNFKDSASIGGYYDKKNNTIVIFNSTFDDFNKKALVHEFMHIFQNSSLDFISELSNECYSREVVRKMYAKGHLKKKDVTKNEQLSYGRGYEKYIQNFYILSSLIPKEELIRYQYNNDINIIINGLAADLNNKEKTTELINILNSARKFNKSTNMFDLDEYFFTDKNNNLYDLYNDFYYQKYGMDIKDDIESFILFFNSNINYVLGDDYNNFEDFLINNISEESKQHNEVYFGRTIVGGNRNIIPKSIFFDDYPYTIIEFNSPENITFEINEEFIEKYNAYLKEKKKTK